MGKGVRGRSSSYLISYDRKRAGRLIVTSASEHRSLFLAKPFSLDQKVPLIGEEGVEAINKKLGDKTKCRSLSSLPSPNYCR